MGFLKKQGFPEESELVMCTVTNVQYHSVFVQLDEYGKSGMIHISEIAPGRIRNIRDYVKEGKKVVCKVLRIKEDRGHIDLSLRRVTEAQKRSKVDELKQQQNAEKIVEFVAKNLKLKPEEFFHALHENAVKESGSLYGFFQDVVQDEKLMSRLGLKEGEEKALLSVIKQRVKPPEVEIMGTLKLESYAPDGVEVIKQSLEKAEKMGKDAITITYLGSGGFKVAVKSDNYKTAEKILQKSVDSALAVVEDAGGKGEFSRLEA